MNDNSYKVIEVDINEILPNRFQPRIQFDEEEILELSDSIKEHGVIQPIVVRTIGDKYEIIAGERRYKASVLAGKETVPVIIKNLNDKDSAEIALIENIQRKNLTPIEEALSYKKILDMGYLTQESLAAKLGKSQSSVANKIRLLNLSDEVQEALLDNKISERHARSLLRLKSISDQNKMLDKITSERLTVRKTDEEIDKILKSPVDETEEPIKKEKIEEKGEISMNNEMNQIPNVVTPQGTAFDIFGGAQPAPTPVMMETPSVQPITPTPVAPEVPSVPAMPTMDMPATPVGSVMPEVPQMGGIQFDANGNVISAPISDVAPVAPVSPEVSSIPVMPTMDMPAAPVAPAMPEVPQMGGIQFDANGNVISAPISDVAPVAPVSPEVSSIPVMPTMDMPAMDTVATVTPEIPQMGGIQFDANGNVISAPISDVAPVAPVSPEVSSIPVMPTMDMPAMDTVAPVTPEIPQIEIVPETSPIMESNSFEPTSPVTVEMQSPEISTMAANNDFVATEPIIITDYSKQYDPVMPNTSLEPVQKVDFKEIINAIRECSEKIEKYGYKIDVEEYDLSTLYQVIFKIEK